MGRRLSLIYPAIAFLMLAVVSTLAVGYLVNYSILEDVLRERVVASAGRVNSGIRRGIEARLAHIVRFKDSWIETLVDLGSLPPEPGGMDESRAPGSLSERWDRLAGFFPFWKLDFLMIVDETGHVVRRLPEGGAGEPLAGDVVAAALARTASGNHWMTLRGEGSGRNIEVFVPLAAGTSARSLVVFGYHLGKLVDEMNAETPGQPFAVLSPQGPVGGALPPGMPPIAANRVRDAVSDGTASLDFDKGREWNLFYAPIQIVDQTLAVAVPVSLEEARMILAGSRQRLVLSGLFIVVVLVASGLALDRLILAPLRRLHGKAVALVDICTIDHHHEDADDAIRGNEVASLDAALNLASTKLYSQIDHLRESNEVLQKLALKDPLTGLLNRQMFMELLQKELIEARRKGRRVAVMVIGLRGSQGHREIRGGTSRDRLLSWTGERLLECVRGEDHVFHIGETEFAAYIPECADEEQALVIARRLHRAVTGNAPAPGLEVAMNVGVSLFPDDGENFHAVYVKARLALDVSLKGEEECCHTYRQTLAFFHRHPESLP